MAIHFKAHTVDIIVRRADGSATYPIQYEARTDYTATEDGNPATAHGYPSRELARRALRTFIHSYRG